MHEIELKFQVPPARRAEVAAAVAGGEAAPPQRLQAVYVDTADRALARHGVALRVRREGERWVQTAKAAGTDGLTRLEHDVELPQAGDEPPAADPARHAGTPAGARLGEALAGLAWPALRPLYRTDIRRRSRRVSVPGAVVELAFDEGAILAGERRLEVCELEIELVSGAPMAVIDTARGWVARHGLWLDTRSKAERGDRLARGEAMAPPREAREPVLDDATSRADRRRAMLRSCLEQVSVNASQVADGAHDDEHVRQLRVGLRRLRTALRPLGEAGGELAAQAALLARRLGPARERVETGTGEGPSAIVRLAPMQSLLLDLLALAQDEAAPT